MTATTDWTAWQRSWGRQQTAYMPDREERLGVLCDLVEAVGGSGTRPVRVLDLACGTGSISQRLLTRVPDARLTALDVDPALLRIASGTFAGDPRVDLVTADLADQSWRGAVEAPYDAVVTATALHWLPGERLTALYAELHDLVRVGGVVANADHMPDDREPARLTAVVEALRDARRGQAAAAEGVADWRGWWDTAAADPALADAVAARFERFGGDHAPEVSPPASWHVRALREAGFAEVGVVWRGLRDAVVAALR
ncbi:MAG: class I SAM-dependent methyltransferase [Actinomycetes bacterium]